MPRPSARSRPVLPDLVECSAGRRGHVAHFGPAGDERGEGTNPAGFVRAAAKIEFLAGDEQAIDERAFHGAGPEAIDQSLESAVQALVGDIAAKADQMPGDVDLDGAGFVAGTAQAAGLGQVFEFSESLEEGCDESADRAGINASVGVAADLAIDGAGVE